MSVGLLDVNVLIALFDPAHPNHEDAHAWFGKNRKRGWAACPLTINGCVRVLSSPAYQTVDATPGDVLVRLHALCSASDHHFWPDSVSLLDERLFDPRRIAGHQKITDVYLLGLAVRQRGKLITCDRSIPLKAVFGADANHLEVLGPSNPPATSPTSL
ncbi:MAG TPA: TA system VapC family ribonuclease toxin [Bryobacteraceae bacterium]